jgi:hypothetical protein
MFERSSCVLLCRSHDREDMQRAVLERHGWGGSGAGSLWLNEAAPSLRRSNIPLQTALVATLDTYDFRLYVLCVHLGFYSRSHPIPSVSKCIAGSATGSWEKALRENLAVGTIKIHEWWHKKTGQNPTFSAFSALWDHKKLGCPIRAWVSSLVLLYYCPYFRVFFRDEPLCNKYRFMPTI